MSSPRFTLLSSVVPLRADFEAFMLELGGRVSPQEDGLSGVLDIDGKWTIEGNYIQFEHPGPYVAAFNIEDLMETSGNEIMQKLGAVPRTYLSLVVYRPKDWKDWPRKCDAAARMVLAFMRRWHSVCYDFDDQLHDVSEYAAHCVKNGLV